MHVDSASSTGRLLAAVTLGAGWYLAQRYLPGQPAFVAQCLLFGLVVARLSRRGLLAMPAPDRVLLAVPGTLLLAALLYRDSRALVALDGVALVLLAALTVPDAAGRPLLLAGPEAYLERVVRAGAGWCLGAIPFAWSTAGSVPRAGRWRSLAAAGLGVAAVSPALLLFGSLLSSADPMFGRVLEAFVAFDLGPLLPHLLGIGVATWGAAGLLWAAARRPGGDIVARAGGRVGGPTVFAALGAIEALFVIYVVLQSRYLFGGYAQVLAAEQLTVADYARRGFFELVTVAGLTLPILLVADWALGAQSGRDRVRFRWHVLGLVGLLFLLLGSALSRMLLYTREFGLTESRVYATACLAWLACVFSWFAVTQVRGVPERFAGGALAAALQVLLLLNLVNVDGTIVRVNLARALEGRPFDPAYVARLGAGAVPALLRGVDRLGERERCAVLVSVASRRAGELSGADRTWNVERVRASGAARRLADRAYGECGFRASAPPPSRAG